MKFLVNYMTRMAVAVAMLVVGTTLTAAGQETGETGEKEAGEEGFSPKEVLFEHLSDAYWWGVAGEVAIPLPVVVRDAGGEWHVFSSRQLMEGGTWEGFYIARGGAHDGKVVGRDARGEEYRPLDLSLTKTACGIVLSALVTGWIVGALARYYRRRGMRAPRRGMGLLESLVEMIYRDTIVGVLGRDARRFAPYLLTVFFFIFVTNMIGLVTVFPGGTNVTGNISVTLVLALCTFVVVNVSGKRAYWKDMFWPEVPVALKCPVPLMPLIEVFGALTKPVALMIRLFANMLGGHLIMLALLCMIFLFSAMGAVVTGVSSVFAVVFSVFMNLIHVLVGFIQAYVFTLLSTIFIGLARPSESE